MTLLVCAGAVRAEPTRPGAGFTLVDQGSAGGRVWAGHIANPFTRSDQRDTDVYLPPDYSPQKRYPVLYLLHGFWGEPSSFVAGLHLATSADEMINANQVRPFIAVMPPGGLPAGTKQQRAQSEWAGPSEDFVVRTVVPWVDTHLPTIRAQRARAIADGRVVGGVFPAVPGRAVRTRVGREACRTRPGAAAQPRRGDFAATVSGSSSQRAAATGPSSGAGRSSSSANCARSASRAVSGLSRREVPGYGRNQLPSALKYAEPIVS
ncbi:MAG: hypothetical protein E6G26_07985 [Actinobacteria bacterium]|nr:MAG: hypothetical protein E6G26_07985 [Actinomycetota bacterium]